jgi:peptide/nickel transport system permease protein
MRALCAGAARFLTFGGLGGALGLALLASVLVAALGAPVIAPHDPLDIVGAPFLWPGEDWSLPLGTDMLGRDIFAGVVHGARISLQIGLLAGVVTTLAGLIVGASAGYFGGAVDQTLMRISELFQIMPALLFAIALVAVLGASTSTIVLGIAVTNWPQVARLVRAEALRVRAADLIQAARVMGLSNTHILLRHLLPNVLAPALVMVSILAGNAILTESALSFLGLGNANIITWGGMIGAGREVLRTEWYMTAIPGVAIFLTVLALSLVGNGLNDVLNPRSKAAG